MWARSSRHNFPSPSKILEWSESDIITYAHTYDLITAGTPGGAPHIYSVLRIPPSFSSHTHPLSLNSHAHTTRPPIKSLRLCTTRRCPPRQLSGCNIVSGMVSDAWLAMTTALWLYYCFALCSESLSLIFLVMIMIPRWTGWERHCVVWGWGRPWGLGWGGLGNQFRYRYVQQLWGRYSGQGLGMMVGFSCDVHVESEQMVRTPTFECSSECCRACICTWSAVWSTWYRFIHMVTCIWWCTRCFA